MNKLERTDSKPRSGPDSQCDYDVHHCPESGGSYQELRGLGAFTEVVPGSRMQRHTDNNYKKTELTKKPDEGGLGGILPMKPDTGGPPYDNVSAPKRVL